MMMTMSPLAGLVLALTLAALLPAPARASSEARFDLAVNQAPAQQVFAQLAEGTDYSMLLPPELAGTISITLKNTTVLEALDSLRELYGYEYRVVGKRIFVRPNGVQTRLFRINYLPGRRQGASDIRVTSGAITQASGNGQNSGGGSNSNSNAPQSNPGQSQRADDSAHVRTTSDADFWREVQSSLNALVGREGGRSVVLNPAAGVVVVRATPGELGGVESYLKAVQLSIERQVMIEAKIIEVELNEGAQTGINWNAFANNLLDGRLKATIGVGAPGVTLNANGSHSDGAGNSVTAGGTLSTSAGGQGFYGLALQAKNFSALLNFLETQGKAHVLSSPRIATLNNQKAVLKVGTDELFVTGVTTTTTVSGTTPIANPSLTLQPFFSGIALDVTPQIDDEGQVMLHVHPSISVVVERNKNIDLGSLGNFRLPLATSTVNETDSIVRVRDSQIVAIGGLMLQSNRDERSGLPGISEAPVIGGLFRQKSSAERKRELVILIKPTVIKADGEWPEAAAAAAAAAQTNPVR